MLYKIYRIFEDDKTHPFLGEFFPAPAGMVGVVKIGFRVRHQAEDSSRFITDTGNPVNRTVGIGRVIHRCLSIIRMTVLDDNMLITV